jgi:hypothetical protein
MTMTFTQTVSRLETYFLAYLRHPLVRAFGVIAVHFYDLIVHSTQSTPVEVEIQILHIKKTNQKEYLLIY